MPKPSPKLVQLKHICVDFHNRRLIQGREQQDIDGQTLRVLQVLIEHYPNTVSRDLLLNEAWPNLVVSDNSLSQCIVNLRRLWDDNPRAPEFIRTVPRQGYQLLTKPQVLPTSATGHYSWFKPALLLVFAVFVVWGGWRIGVDSPDPGNQVNESSGQAFAGFTPTHYVTTQPGIESFQRFSPDGHWLAYAQSTSQSDYDLVIAEIESNNHRVLLDGPDDTYPGDWSPDGRHLLAVRQRNGDCELVMLTPGLPEQPDYPLYSCEYHDLPARLRWVADNRIYLAHSLAGEPQLTRLTLFYNREEAKYQVSDAQAVAGLHPENLDSSPDGGRYLLLSERRDSESHYRLTRYDTQSGKIEVMDTQLSPYWGISWFGDSSQYLAGARLRVGTLQGEFRDIYPTTSVVLDVDYHPSGKIAISEARAHINLALLESKAGLVEDNSTLPRLAPSSQVDFLPVFSPGGDQLAFVSSRHGLWQLGLWRMTYPDGKPELLKKLDEGILPQQLRWSKKGRYLAMIDNQHRLYCYDLQQAYWEQVTAPGEEAFYPFWVDDALAFNLVTDGQIHLVEAEQCSAKRTRSRKLNHFAIHRFDDGSLLLGSPDTGRVQLQQEGGMPTQIAEVESLEAIYAGEEGLYYFRKQGKHSVLMFKHYQHATEKPMFRAVTANYGNVARQFAVLETNGVMVMPVPGEHQADIVVLEDKEQ